MKYKIILAILLTIAFLLRAVDVSGNPKSLYGDELTIVYDAYSILKTGKDQLGNTLPLTFPMGAGRPGGYVYFTIPFVAIFGPNALGVRMPSVVLGVGVVLFMYLIGAKLLSRKVGIWVAALSTFSFWDISLSRVGFEAHLALVLMLGGIYSFLAAQEKSKLLIPSGILFGLVLHTYPIYKMVLPIFLVLFLWFSKIFKSIQIPLFRKNFFIATTFFILLIFLSISQTFIGGSENRLAHINIFSNKEISEKITQKVNTERTTSGLSPLFSKIVHNKFIELTKMTGTNYINNYSMDFLFLYGDRNPRHNTATIGQLNLVFLILLPAGLIRLWIKDKRLFKFFLIWLLLAPIPTALVGDPHALRSSFLLPPLILISALGLESAAVYRKKIFLYIVFIITILQSGYFLQKLYFLAPYQNLNFWSYSAKQASNIAIKNQDDYDYIILSDRIDNIEFAYPVYALIDPNQVIAQNKKRALLNDLQLKRFRNIYIGFIPKERIDSFIASLSGRVLYIDNPDQTPIINNFETIKDPAGKDILIIKKIKNEKEFIN